MQAKERILEHKETPTDGSRAALVKHNYTVAMFTMTIPCLGEVMEPMTLGNMRALFVINAEYARRSLQLKIDQPEGRAPEGRDPGDRCCVLAHRGTPGSVAFDLGASLEV